jgi:cobyrinic acid a,c-diamide synthase
MRDKCLPNADLYYFGGGFPELYAEQLGGNLSMLESLRQSASKGAPIYAECGGMIYLTKGISVTDHYYPLADLLPAKTQMTKMPVGRGYVEFDITSSSIENSPWRLQSQKNIKAHEFHYSKLIDLDPDLKLNYSMSKGVGIDSGWDGWIHDSIFASYVHIHSESAPWWADLLKQTARFWQKK